MMKAIVAVDMNWGIGKDNKLLMSIPDDLQNFKRLTVENIVVMGRKTFESLPGKKALPDRVNIVLSGDPTFDPDNVIVCRGLDHALDMVTYFEQMESRDTYIIGGSSIYNLFLPYCHSAIVTHISHTFEHDTVFPNLSVNKNWFSCYDEAPKIYDKVSYYVEVFANKEFLKY